MLTIFSRKAIRNIFNLEKPEGGDCLSVSLAYHPVFEAYAVLKQMEKLSPYILMIWTRLYLHNNILKILEENLPSFC